jgi:hypothetical protein
MTGVNSLRLCLLHVDQTQYEAMRQKAEASWLKESVHDVRA